MTDENPTSNTLDALSTGAVITVNVPCKVRVLDIAPVAGSIYRGNCQVSWEMVAPIETAGTQYIGSKVQLSVWD